MKLVCRTWVWGWVLTGIVGKHGKWFFGFSRAADPNAPEPSPQAGSNDE